jgi:hypothetical protein
VKCTLLAGIIGVLVAAIPVHAHHSFASEFIESQSISIEGDVREFQFRNPHAILLVDARDVAGHAQTYAAEWAGAGRLGRMGIDTATLKPGDHVIVTGSPGRNPSDHTIHLKQIQRPSDGWSWRRGRGRTYGR